RSIAAGGLRRPAGEAAPERGGVAASAGAAGAAGSAAGAEPAPAGGSNVVPTADAPPGPIRGAGPAAEGLRVLAAAAAGCTRCRRHAGVGSVVCSEGNCTAVIVCVWEAPGCDEDRTGRRFVGPAGKLLDLLLLSVGFPRESVYICNVLTCRPPQNRDPQRDEMEACTGYLHRQLELIEPRVLLAVGKFAAQTLTGSDASIGRLRGRVHEYMGIPVVATYHPAYLLRSPDRTRAAWQDLQFMRE